MDASQSAEESRSGSSTIREETSKQLLEAVKSVLKCRKDAEKTRDISIKIERLLKAGADSRARDDNGNTALALIATLCKEDYDDIIQNINKSQTCTQEEFVLEYFISRADANSRDIRGSTSLHWAAHRCNIEMVRMLLSAGAEPDPIDNRGNTPLLFGAGKHHDNEEEFLEVAKMLIAAGANIHATSNGGTVLQRAHQRQNSKLVNLLLALGASLDAVDQNGFNALLHAVRTKNMKTVRKLIDEGHDVNFINTKGVRKNPSAPMTALHIAVIDHNVAMLKCLLERGADPNRTNKIGRSILSFAVRPARSKIKKHKKRKDMMLEKIELLLSYGADMYDGGLNYPESPFESLVSRNRVAEVELFLKHGLDIGRYSPRTPSDFSPLHEAVRCGSGTEAPAMLLLLLQHDCKGLLDLDHVDALGRSPLCLAAEMGSPNAIKLLMDRGADVDHVAGKNRAIVSSM